MNKVILLGRLTVDPELKTVGNDAQVCKFGLAVNRRFKKENQEADFFNVITWNKQAEHCNKYLTKGALIALVGRIEIDKWQDSDGNNRYTTNIVAEEVHFTGKPVTSDNTGKQESKNDNKKSKSDDDGFPF